MPQEHERSLGGSQSEWPTVAAAIQTTGVAAASVAEIVEGLTVDTTRMRRNLEETRGIVFAEKATVLLAEKFGRERAHELLEAAVRKAVEEKRELSDVLGELPEIIKIVDKASLQQLAVPEDYLGSAESFRREMLRGTTPITTKS
jgi:3-carboxy-cis,cis-muconate cycloisomerase